MRNIAMFVAATYFCSGCAGVAVNSLGSSASADTEARGFRYWQTAPFLFVRSDGQGGLSGDIKWLPDTTQKMSARPFAIFATNESKLDFTNGTLTSAMIKANETEVVTASLTALGKVLVAAAADGRRAQTPPSKVPLPHIYKIVIEGDKISLIGGAAKGMDGINDAVILSAPKEGEQQ